MIAPRRFSRLRIAAFAAIERAAVLLGGRALYRRRHLSRARLHVREEWIEVPGLPSDLDGFSIAHLSDLHAGPFLGAGDLGGVIGVLTELAPDVVCWTGDFVVHGIHNVRPLQPELGKLVGARATFAVFGNHDYLHREEWRFVEAMEPAGWRFLRNDSAVLEVGGARVGFCGIEDPEEGKVVDVERAVSGLCDGDVTGRPDLIVALSHGPQAAPQFAARGAHVVLAGHSHGTQVDLPFLRDLGPAHPGLRVEVGASTLVVSRGIGVIGAPLRVGVPAEVVVLRFRPASPSVGG
ncbi:MAG: metallophosphoesterase [Planctomycetes bacterium]|nr:metallophosphoesterase [Planctomycetota bacterium]